MGGAGDIEPLIGSMTSAATWRGDNTGYSNCTKESGIATTE